jgi:hypothetical protein
VPAVPVHHTETSPAAWDGPAQVKNIPGGASKALLSDVFAWLPADEEPTKTDSSLPHHFVSADGKPGDASTKACSAAIGALNGGRGGVGIPTGDRKATWTHLVAHLKDSGVAEKDLPELEGASTEDAAAFAQVVAEVYAEPAPDGGTLTADMGQAAPMPTSDGGAGGNGQPDMKRFHIPIGVVEGAPTSDGRQIKPGALRWRTPPLPLMATDAAPHGNLPTTDARHIGTITHIERRDVSGEPDGRGGTYPDGAQALASRGEYDDHDLAREFARRAYANEQNHVSADIGDVTAEYDQTLGDDGEPVDETQTMTDGELLGFTVIPHPAFAGCYMVGDDGQGNPLPHPSEVLAMEPDGDEAGNRSDGDGDEPPSGAAAIAAASPAPWIVHDRPVGLRRCIPCEEGTLTASAGPMEPPSAWFVAPELGELTPLTVTADGRIFGHLAAWGTCHTGISGQCVTPPRGGNYSHYRVGSVLTADGDLVPTGTITMGTGHAPTAGRLSAADVMAHYDNTGTAIADVAAGEDAYGIWIAGAMRPDVTELQVRQLRGAALSGDWRLLGGRLQLVAALAVNTPGFPVPRALAASGTPIALVAAGAPAVAALARRRDDPAAVAAEALQELARRGEAAAHRVEQVALRLEARRLRDAIHRAAA